MAYDAFVEKVVNASDSVLTSKVISDGIDPENINEAPTSVKDAMEKYLGIKNGDITSLGSRTQVNILADKCGGVVLTGSKHTPNIAIYDFGEGQEPIKFSSTFCGMSESNKQKIKFEIRDKIARLLKEESSGKTKIKISNELFKKIQKKYRSSNKEFLERYVVNKAEIAEYNNFFKNNNL